MCDDERVAAWLLPYLVADALCCGDARDCALALAELRGALAFANSCSKRDTQGCETVSGIHNDAVVVDPVVFQLVFALHETLE